MLDIDSIIIIFNILDIVSRAMFIYTSKEIQSRLLCVKPNILKSKSILIRNVLKGAIMFDYMSIFKWSLCMLKVNEELLTYIIGRILMPHMYDNWLTYIIYINDNIGDIITPNQFSIIAVSNKNKELLRWVVQEYGLNGLDDNLFSIIGNMYWNNGILKWLISYLNTQDINDTSNKYTDCMLNNVYAINHEYDIGEDDRYWREDTRRQIKNYYEERISKKSILDREDEKKDILYKGTVNCTNKGCNQRANYIQDKTYLCGRHIDKGKKNVLLPKNVKDLNILLKQHAIDIRSIAKENRMNKIYGHVICYKMKTIEKNPNIIKGYMNIFTSIKHGNRKDGITCRKLLPLYLGPVKHNEPNYPDARTISSYREYSIIRKKTDNRDDYRKNGFFTDCISVSTYEKNRKDYDNEKNYISVYTTLDGKEKREFNHIESRFFYCKAYEALLKDNKKFKRLKQMLQCGINLRICGFDVYFDANKTLYEHYCNIKEPFEHELILYTLLTIHNKNEYPWNIYKEKHHDRYNNIAHM